MRASPLLSLASAVGFPPFSGSPRHAPRLALSMLALSFPLLLSSARVCYNWSQRSTAHQVHLYCLPESRGRPWLPQSVHKSLLAIAIRMPNGCNDFGP